MHIINLYGASGHAKVILDIIINMENVEIGHIFDDDISKEVLLGHQILSPSVHQDQLNRYPVIISVGNNSVREQLVHRLVLSSFADPIIHNSASLSEEINIQEGSVVMPQVVINASTFIGKHCIINSGAVVEHDCVIGDFVHISPGACVCGGVKIGKGSHIGASAVIIPGVDIGENVVIGAGAVVLQNVPHGSKVVGNPGKIISN